MSKKRSKATLSKGLQAIDLFEDSIHLNIDGARTLKTSLGGLLSLAIIIFLAVQGIIQAVSIFKREKPSIVQMKDIEDDPLTVALNTTNNFIFSIGITQNNANVNMSNGSVISFLGEYSHQIRDTSGNLKKQKGRIMWAPCVETNFSLNVFPPNTFSSYSLKYAYCPTMMNFTNTTSGACPDEVKNEYPNCLTPFEFSLQGNFLSFNFRYLQISVHSCDQTDDSLIKGLDCSTQSVSDIFANSEIKLNLYYANTLVSPLDHSTPNKTYIDTTYWSINPAVYKLADIYIDSVTVQDYDDFFSEDKYHNSSFFSLNVDNMRETQVFHRTEMLEINLRRSNTNSITVRRYSKVLDVVSSIGGISKVLLVIGAVIALGYSRYKHQMILSNKLYDYPPQNKSLKRSSGSMKLKKTLQMAESRRDTSTASQLKPPAKKGAAGEDDAIKDYFETQRKEKRMLNFNLYSYWKSLFNQVSCKKDPEDELGQKARIQATEDLDIIKIVEKLKEIDKLKLILLNRHQREAFNFIEKPLITLKNEKPLHRDSVEIFNTYTPEGDDSPVAGRDKAVLKARQEYDSLTKYSRLYMAYTQLKADCDPRNWKYNKKILNMIGEDLIGVFQKVDEHLGENPDPKRFEETIQKLTKRESAESPEIELKYSGV